MTNQPNSPPAALRYYCCLNTENYYQRNHPLESNQEKIVLSLSLSIIYQ
jgi:hypothetical protein